MGKRIQLPRAAELLGVSLRLTQKLCQQGHLKACKVGSRWTTTETDIASYLNRPRQIDECPTIKTFGAMRTARITPESRSTAGTCAGRYAQLISGQLASSSRRSSNRRRSGARA
ncbi:helix-turn-helix domain-containing protein [Gluconacetobacter entanii]|nr:helix-turn-helix domain-containing protein [Gluconacetobacter entanii]